MATSGRCLRSAASYPNLIKAWLPALPRPAPPLPACAPPEVPLPPGLAPKRVSYFRTLEESIGSGD